MRDTACNGVKRWYMYIVGSNRLVCIGVFNSCVSMWVMVGVVIDTDEALCNLRLTGLWWVRCGCDYVLKVRVDFKRKL